MTLCKFDGYKGSVQVWKRYKVLRRLYESIGLGCLIMLTGCTVRQVDLIKGGRIMKGALQQLGIHLGEVYCLRSLHKNVTMHPNIYTSQYKSMIQYIGRGLYYIM